ncbi:MAG: hypothetical protein AB3N64_13450 [Puniceicoccaceae bacterium]
MKRFKFNQRLVYLLSGTLGLTPFALQGAEPRYLDNYEEEARLFGTASGKQHIDHDLAERIRAPYYFVDGHKAYRGKGFSYDFEDKRVGDFCITFATEFSEDAERFGFMTSLWGLYPELDEDFRLKLFLKTVGVAEAIGPVDVTLVDQEGQKAEGVLQALEPHSDWQAVELSLRDLEREAAFDFKAVKLCEFAIPESLAGATLKLDFVRFENSEGSVIGITDKTIDQRISEQRATKETRTQKAFELSAEKAHEPIISAFAMLYLNQDVAEANQIIREDCKRMGATDKWSLMRTPMYCRLYLWFSSRSTRMPGRLEEATEKLLLETLWERTKLKNDIHWARQSTWILDGSENHDLNAKASNLVSSRIFMNEPAYKDRAFPNLGFGGAYHYGGSGYYGKGVDPKDRQGGGRANLSDGKPYTAKDHYAAWLGYMKEYFRERARHGFFLENSSHTYSKHSMNMIDLAYAYSGDEELRGIIDDFLTLYWADWVQTGIAGISGGPKTRHHKTVGGYGSNKGMISHLIGGPADGGIWSYWSSINGYEMPKVVQMMALDREGMGDFVYQARGIGEAEAEQPRPFGTERSLVIEPESRFRKYSYVTPHYTLSTQMDHPWAVHSHLSKAGRWHGMTVTRDVNTRIVPVTLPIEPDFRGNKAPYAMECVYKAFQHNNTLIIQRSRAFNEVNPDWFPLYRQRTDQGVYIGNAWDERLEKDGWIFLRKGGVYAALRVVLWDEKYEKEKAKKAAPGNQRHFNKPEDDPTVKLKDLPYSFNEDGSIVVLEHLYSPVIMQAGDEGQFGSFEDFQDSVLGAEIALYKTVVPSFNILVFNTPGTEPAEMVFNAANNEIPMLNGEYIEYAWPKTFDSPFIQSMYKSTHIRIVYGGEVLELDF